MEHTKSGSLSVYKRHPLRAKGDIRVLRLYPSKPRSEPLQGSLSVVSLDRNPTFAALSYTWGPPIDGLVLDDGEITLSGNTVTITGNLSDALRRLRMVHELQDLWVDALCINQADDVERSSQVAIMARIYSAADVVFSWVGEEYERLFFDYARSKGPVLAESLNFSALKHQTDEPSRRRFLGKLFEEQRRYFKRRWVLQEVFFAREIYLICGSTLMPLERLMDHAVLNSQTASGHYEYGILNDLKRYPAYFRDESKRLRRSVLDKTSSLLVQFQNFECEDPRDRLFAIASLKKDIPLTPDYSLSTEETYTRFAKGLVQQSSAEDLVPIIRIAAYQASQAQSSLSLPSWVPNWESTLPESGLRGYGDMSSQIEFQGVTETNGLCLKIPCFEVLVDPSDFDDLQLRGEQFAAFWKGSIVAVGSQPDQNLNAVGTVREGDLVCVVGLVSRSCGFVEEAVVFRPLLNLKNQYEVAGIFEINRGGRITNSLCVLDYREIRDVCIV